MSFLKNIFSKKKKKDMNNNDEIDISKKDQNLNLDEVKSGVNELSNDEESTSNTKNSSLSNYSKCKSMPVTYVEMSESELRVDNLSLFDGTKLIYKKLYELFIESVEKYSPEQFVDDYRPQEANKHGGIDYKNKEITSLIRSTGTEIIYQLGKKLLSGDFNLTTISFPIKVMIPLTILQSIARSLFQFPYYMHLACDKDIIEKMKFTIVASLSSFFCSCWFLKPLNPVLGETFEAMFSDGTKIYFEQTSHHPPVSNYQLYGPNGNWSLDGHSVFSSSAWLNSCTVNNKGKRIVKFKDGTKIDFDFCKEYYSNTFWGVFRHESMGDLTYSIEKEGLLCKLKIGGIKGKPSDNLFGEITHNGKVVSKISGSYLSNITFDGKRYWDIRENFPIGFIDTDKNLPSSSIYRQDRILLEEGKLEAAQDAKEKIENLQRMDRKLREKNHNKK